MRYGHLHFHLVAICFASFICNPFAMTALPPMPTIFNASPTVVGGYTLCQRLEKDILENRSTVSSTSLSPLVCVRILGWLIIHSPTDIGRINVAKEVISCNSSQSIIELGVYYNDHFIRCCEWLV
jgi:hypothetical protein